MVTDINKYRESRIVPFEKVKTNGIPIFERVFIHENKLVGETIKGTRVLIKEFEREN